jgi:predicted  nucleic acid-binding Zn-ribbon protein
MVNCPKCGSKVQNPLKRWPIPTRKPLREGEKPKLVGIFECSECRGRFRAAVEPETKAPKAEKIEEMVGKIEDVKNQLILMLTNLRKNIKTIETKNAGLMKEIEKLREVSKSKANALEDEVSMLREQVRSLRDLLENTELRK